MLQAISVWTLWTRPSLVANSRQHPLSPFALIIWIKHIRTYTGTISIWPVKSYDGFQMHNTLRHLTTLWTILIKFCKKNHAKGSYRSAIFVKLRSPNGAAQIVKYWTVLKICRTKCLYWNIKLYLKTRTKCLNALTLWLFFQRMHYSLRHYYASGNRCSHLTKIRYNTCVIFPLSLLPDEGSFIGQPQQVA